MPSEQPQTIPSETLLTVEQVQDIKRIVAELSIAVIFEHNVEKQWQLRRWANDIAAAVGK